LIIGRGLLANAVKRIDSKQFLYYANGISNSILPRIEKDNFEIRDLKEIAEKYPQKVFIYFSTCQINSDRNLSRPYVRHKILMEEFISKNFSDYLIVRTSNLVGFNPWNPHTLFNFLNHALAVNEQIFVNPVLLRNFLDVEHFVSLLNLYLNRHNKTDKIVEIVNPDSYSMHQIIWEFEKFFSKKFNMYTKTENDFAFFELNPKLTLQLLAQSCLTFDDHIQTLLRKYYC
jgi:hypothetical protein